jgi:hypothetical protein
MEYLLWSLGWNLWVAGWMVNTVLFVNQVRFNQPISERQRAN